MPGATPNKQKILFVITQGEWGGAQRYVYDLATELTGQWTVAVAVGEPAHRRDLQEKLEKRNTKSEADEKIKVFQLRHLVRRIAPYHDLAALRELMKLYRQEQPDIVHLNSSKAGLLGSLATRSLLSAHRSPAIVYTAHGWVFNEPVGWWRRTLYWYLEKWTTNQKNAVIVLSRHDQASARRLGLPANRIHCIPLGLTPTSLTLTRAQARELIGAQLPTPLSPATPWFGTVANLYRTKGLDILTEAVGRLPASLPPAQFFIIGEGPERPRLESLIKKYRLEGRMHLLGAITNAAVLLPAFDCFVLPSRKEGLPYTLLEASAARLPIIATTVGGIPELIADHQNGLLVAPRISEITATLAFALTHLAEMERYTTALAPPPALGEMVAKTTVVYRSLRRWP